MTLNRSNSRSQRVIALFLVAAMLFFFVPQPKAKAVVVVDDLFVGGAIAAWLAGMGISLSASFSNEMGTPAAMSQGIMNLLQEYAGQLSLSSSFVSDLQQSIMEDVGVVRNSGSTYLSFGSGVANSLLGFGNWVIDSLGITSGMTSSVPLFSHSGIFLNSGVEIPIRQISSTSNDETVQTIISGAPSMAFELDTRYYLQSGYSFELTLTELIFYNSDSSVLARRDAWSSLPIYTPVHQLPYAAHRSGKQDPLDMFLAVYTDSSGEARVQKYISPLSSNSYLRVWQTDTLTLDGLGKDVLPDLDEVEEDNTGYVSIPQSITGTLNPDWTDTDLMTGVLTGGLSGTLTNEGTNAFEISQSTDVPADPPDPPSGGEFDTPGLSSVFPFCIPFDIYNFYSCLLANRETPHIEGTIDLGIFQWDVDLNLSDFNSVATILRTMELLAFCVFLALKTRDLIRG